MLLYSSIESIHTVLDVTEKYMIYKSVNYLYIMGSVLQWLILLALANGASHLA